MIAWIKNRTTSQSTSQPQQKIHGDNVSSAPSTAAGTAQSAPFGEFNKLTQGGSPQGLRMSSSRDNAEIAQSRAQQINGEFTDTRVSQDDKLELANRLSKYPHAAVANIGTQGTLLEHSFARLAKTQPRPGQEPSQAHQDELEITGFLMQQYNKMADNSPNARAVIARSAKLALAAGPKAQDYVVGCLHAYKASLSNDHYTSQVRSVASHDNPVTMAEALVHQDLKEVLGGNANVAKALRIPAVKEHYHESIAELAVAGQAYKLDIRVPGNLFNRQGNVTGHVSQEYNDLMATHHGIQTVRDENQLGASETYKRQEPDIMRLAALLGACRDATNMPSPQTLRAHLADADEILRVKAP